MRISEARLNDFCYITLKKIFFESAFGDGVSPRQCDIRICMDMAVPSRITSIQQAILLPDEVAPASHEVFYEVELDKIFEECVLYIEDHWMKQTLDEACGPGSRAAAKEFFTEVLVPVVLNTEEEKCGVTE